MRKEFAGAAGGEPRHCLVPSAKTNVERDGLHLTTPGEAGSGGTSYSGRHDRGVEMSESSATPGGVARRSILRIGAIGTAGLAFGAVQGVVRPFLGNQALLSPDGAFAATADALAGVLYLELFPTSPLIVSPFTDVLPIPRALAPVPKSVYSSWKNPPGPGRGQQSSLGNQQHQIWPSRVGYPDPIVYKIDLLTRTHAFTTSQVLPIDSNGAPTVSFEGTSAGTAITHPAGEQRTLPPSTIYGFNGTFPGP